MILALAASLSGESTGWAADPSTGWIIAFGGVDWGTPPPQIIAEHLAEWDAMPFDGLVFDLSRGTVHVRCLDLTQPWSQDELEADAKFMASLPLKQLRRNFARVNTCAIGVDWFDDASWNQLAERLGGFARAVRMSGAAGIVLDTEQYGKTNMQFNYSQMARRNEVSFAQYNDMTRRRGAQAMRAMREAFPGLRLLVTFASSLVVHETRHAAIDQTEYGLLSGFFEGLLEESEGCTVIDGFENAYYFRSRDELTGAAKMIREDAAGLCKNPEMYRQRVRAGFAFWPPMSESQWSSPDFTANHHTPVELEYVLHHALKLSDGIVWVYGGGAKWTDAPREYFDAIRRAKLPHADTEPGRAGVESDRTIFTSWYASRSELHNFQDTWQFRTDPQSRGVSETWFAPDADDIAWQEMAIRDFWTARDIKTQQSYTGDGWYRITFDVPQAWLTGELLLVFGAADERAWVYLNGQLAMDRSAGDPAVLWNQPFALDCRPFVKPGRNVLVVRVHNSAGPGGLWRGVKLFGPSRSASSPVSVTPDGDKFSMDRNMRMPSWMWSDLIGFDHLQPEESVRQFLDECHGMPEAISLFLYSPHFVHDHAGLDEEAVFPREYCSYIKPRNSKRSRQPWTNVQLKRLVDALHAHGVRVYLSVFAVMYDIADGPLVPNRWTREHPELLGTLSDGSKHHSLVVHKSFRDGTPYVDYFVPRLLRVMKDYGFDGFHGADGYSPPHQPLMTADYSDEMVGRFAADRGVQLPEELSGLCDEQPEILAGRAKWIWKHARAEWIRFNADLTTAFWSKVTQALHGAGKKIVLNNAWTREPFEALYRYGVDYHQLASLGIDGFVPETVSTVVQMDGWDGKQPLPLFDAMAMTMLMNAQSPQTPLYPLVCTRDVLESWDNLAHAPASLEREMHAMSNLYTFDTSRQLLRSVTRPMYCLADDIRPWEWSWLDDNWTRGSAWETRGIRGLTVIFSQPAHDKQLNDYLQTRRMTTHRYMMELMRRGVTILAAANIEQLFSVRGPILVVNPHLLSEPDLEMICSYPHGPVVLLGGKAASRPLGTCELSEGAHPDDAAMTIYRPQCELPSMSSPKAPKPAWDASTVEETSNWAANQPYRPVSGAFLDTCATGLIALTDAPKVTSTSLALQRQADDHDALPSIVVQQLDGRPGTARLLVGNNTPRNLFCNIDVHKEIDRVNVVTRFPLMIIEHTGSVLRVKAPAMGVTVMDIAFKSQTTTMNKQEDRTP
ncbi:MAG: hypothetical protein IT442_03345 [Phycisphaeraceae bacterium]|nr:hypothetical protein [Phycisphaeraceae bacterium]